MEIPQWSDLANTAEIDAAAMTIFLVVFCGGLAVTWAVDFLRQRAKGQR